MTVGDPAATHASGPFREFVGQVQRAGELPSPEEAEQLVRATFDALGAQISQGQATQLRSGLPPELVSELLTHGGRQAHAVDERTFLDQISGSVGAGDLETVEQQVRVVFRTLSAWAPPGEIDDMSAQVPPGLAGLFRG